MQPQTVAIGEKAANGSTWEGEGWRVDTVKRPILSAGEIDQWTDQLQIPIPEMIFGNNLVKIEHIESGMSIHFNAYDALDLVDKSGKNLIQVAHSQIWQKSRQKRSAADVNKMAKPFDWTYSTDFRGTTSSNTPDITRDAKNPGSNLAAAITADAASVTAPSIIRCANDENALGPQGTIDHSLPKPLVGISAPTGINLEEGRKESIEAIDKLYSPHWVADDKALLPIELLSRPDPILLFDEVCLYEDELGDNGIVWLNVKVRVMPERLLILSRFFLRVDEVMFRVRDTRVYVEFATTTVIREYREQEGEYRAVRSRVPMVCRDASQYMRDANWVSQHLNVKKLLRERLTWK